MHPTTRAVIVAALIPSSLAPHASSVASRANTQASKNVLIVGTGGTIASAGDYYRDRGGKSSSVSVDQLIKAVPGIDKLATISFEQLYNVGSSAMGPTQWLVLSRRVNRAFAEQPGLSGVVVTHGTDTMEETAYFLDLTVSDSRPVVVTGSMRPSDAIGPDGPANLYAAVRLAAAPAARGRGTMVVMNDRAFTARTVTKTNSSRVETFQAPDHGPIAIIDHDTVVFDHAAPARRRAFDLTSVRELPRVDVLYVYGGADSALVDAAVAAGARGIVMAGVGEGRPTPGQNLAIRRAIEKGVVVVMTTRTGSGRVNAAAQPWISGEDLNAQKARILLMLALTQSRDSAEVRRVFAEHAALSF